MKIETIKSLILMPVACSCSFVIENILFDREQVAMQAIGNMGVKA